MKKTNLSSKKQLRPNKQRRKRKNRGKIIRERKRNSMMRRILKSPTKYQALSKTKMTMKKMRGRSRNR